MKNNKKDVTFFGNIFFRQKTVCVIYSFDVQSYFVVFCDVGKQYSTLNSIVVDSCLIKNTRNSDGESKLEEEKKRKYKQR